MPITIGSNIASLLAQRKLGEASDTQGRVLERLASGMRINRAADDAAGLSIATSLNADAKILNRSLLNVNDGVSMLNVAQGALDALSDIVTRMQELASQSANGSYSNNQRKALNNESNALFQEYARIVESTTFNGKKLLQANAPATQLQAGASSGDIIGISLGELFSRTVGDGTFQSGITIGASEVWNDAKTGDFNGDGIMDVIANGGTGDALIVYLGNGDGTFRRNQYAAGGSWGLSLGDFNNDGVLDVLTTHAGLDRINVILGNADGSFRAPTAYSGVISTSLGSATIGDFDGDGNMDIATAHEGTHRIVIMRGNGDGTFKAAISQGAMFQAEGVAAGDLNGDGLDDLIVRANNWSGDAVQIYLSNGDGTFRWHQNLANQSHGDFFGPLTGDVDNDGDLDFITNHYNGSQWVARLFINNGSGTFTASQTLDGANRQTSFADVNGDGHLDYVGANYSGGGISISYGNGDGSFKAAVSFAGMDRAVAGDFDGDGAVDLVGNGSASRFYKANTTKTTALPYFDIKTQESARQVMGILASAATRISQEKGTIGASMSRLSVAADNLRNQRDNYMAAASRIMDTDVAEDVAKLVQSRILQQVSTAVLAQANLQPQLALSLLKAIKVE